MGENPIPTPILDKLADFASQFRIEERLLLIDSFNTKSPNSGIIDWEKERKKLIEILNPVTPEERIEKEISGHKNLLSRYGQTMTKETEEEYRRGEGLCQMFKAVG